ncbi:dihydrodipicolinate synthase family protein [Candidatus Chrysopegis kryptomonas]|uniref:Dihydrodipicolinate synthase/N-acetylneuraminate lyase n=1 Tax=Candidatus Chryseopegocella kryptomonas TaxID=1633643 RepID=A0A0P1MLI0_9BACT|nr:dihydrodipicolinate synthase family protein [Candidatus Chrysopegis kryptomonas]CUS96324.1 Dihydrodipicolinate synthase/N-acetylneuraminate lyase [Candidatus Chrysopegis kryptomonas]
MKETGMRKIKLEGIIPAVVTPMKSDFSIDFVQLKNYINWIKNFDGLGGVAVNMDTGEGIHLSRDEKMKILETWVENVNGKFPILCGLTTRYTKEAVDEAKLIEKIGADAIVVFPIPAYAGNPLPSEIPYRYHKSISDAVDLPLVLFQLQPSLSGVFYDDETLLRLVSIKNVIGIKEASADALKFVQTMSVLRNSGRKISILTGNDDFILESFILGADGALIGFGTIAVAEQIEMFKAVKERNYDRAFEIYSKIKPLEEVIFSPPVRDYRARVKEALRMIGVLKTSFVRPPLLPVSNRDKEKIKKALKNLGYKLKN